TTSSSKSTATISRRRRLLRRRRPSPRSWRLLKPSSRDAPGVLPARRFGRARELQDDARERGDRSPVPREADLSLGARANASKGTVVSMSWWQTHFSTVLDSRRAARHKALCMCYFETNLHCLSQPMGSTQLLRCVGPALGERGGPKGRG